MVIFFIILCLVIIIFPPLSGATLLRVLNAYRQSETCSHNSFGFIQGESSDGRQISKTCELFYAQGGNVGVWSLK